MNIYWPVYKNLESEFLKIMYYVHIDDNQLSVYSSKVADLILRAAVEIESISKELYIPNGGTKQRIKRFDDEVLDDLLIPAWSLDKKVVIISSHNCFQTQREIFPFQKTENKTFRPLESTFSWNNAYQNLKHDRGKSLSFGSIKYLFDIMAALFLLNLYYKDERIQLEKDYKGFALSPAMGSDIFSIEIIGCNEKYEINKALMSERFSRSVYCIKMTDETANEFYEEDNKFNLKVYELAYKDPLAQAYIRNNASPLFPDKLIEVIGSRKFTEEYSRKAMNICNLSMDKCRYEAVLNTNQFKKMDTSVLVPESFWGKDKNNHIDK